MQLSVCTGNQQPVWRWAMSSPSSCPSCVRIRHRAEEFKSSHLLARLCPHSSDTQACLGLCLRVTVACTCCVMLKIFPNTLATPGFQALHHLPCQRLRIARYLFKKRPSYAKTSHHRSIRMVCPEIAQDLRGIPFNCCWRGACADCRPIWRSDRHHHNNSCCV